jgi:hypothetical protein
MSGRVRMVHLRTVPDAWHAKVLEARLGCEGIVTQLRGNLSGPYPFGTVTVLVEEEQAELAAELLLADEVESAFSWPAWQEDQDQDQWLGAGPDFSSSDLWPDEGEEGQEESAVQAPPLIDLDTPTPGHKPRSRWRRALAAAAAILVAGAPVLAHFVG